MSRCTSARRCSGIFLDRADLGALVEAENDWHRRTAARPPSRLPRITADMTAPPPATVTARSYLETLFG